MAGDHGGQAVIVMERPLRLVENIGRIERRCLHSPTLAAGSEVRCLLQVTRTTAPIPRARMSIPGVLAALWQGPIGLIVIGRVPLVLVSFVLLLLRVSRRISR